MRRVIVGTLLALSACAGPEAPADPDAPAAFGLTVDGQVVACARPSLLEVGPTTDVRVAIADGAPEVSNGWMVAPDRPGLGVTPDFDRLGEPVAVITA